MIVPEKCIYLGQGCLKSLLSRQKSGLKLKDFEADFTPDSTINCIFRVKATLIERKKAGRNICRPFGFYKLRL